MRHFFLLVTFIVANFGDGFADNQALKSTFPWLTGSEYGHFSDPTLRGSGSVQSREYPKAAIASDAPRCGKIAGDILKVKGAHIAEATIAALVCYGAVNSGYSGIGGGLQVVYYEKKKATVLISREKAPDAATEDMFTNDPDKAERGGLGVAVPGEVKGYMELYKKFGGNVPWPDLFKPTIKMLRGGGNDDYDVNKNNNVGHSDCGHHSNGTNQDCLNDPIVQQRRNDRLADTLQKIADSNGNAFYDPKNELCKSIVSDIKERGGIITTNDMAKFNSKWVNAVSVPLDGGLILHTAPPPSGGVLMAFALRVLQAFKAKSRSVQTFQYLTEALKHAYGARPKLGDPDDPRFTQMVNDAVKNLTLSKEYLNSIVKKISPTSTSQDRNYYSDTQDTAQDHGTAAFAIVGQNGDAMVLTTTLNFYNGAQFMGSKTGIIFNNQMNDFSYKRKRNEEIPSVANVIRPGKRPLSSATPTIFVDSRTGVVKLVTAGIGGTLIPGAVTSVVINNLYFGKSLKDSLDEPRLHHTLGPMAIQSEHDFDEQILSGLRNIGHKVNSRPSNHPGTACVGIVRTNKGLIAGYDWRKPGSLDGY